MRHITNTSYTHEWERSGKYHLTLMSGNNLEHTIYFIRLKVMRHITNTSYTYEWEQSGDPIHQTEHVLEHITNMSIRLGYQHRLENGTFGSEPKPNEDIRQLT